MSFLKFLKSKVFWLQVGLSIVAIIILLFLTQWILGIYTNSGRTIIVPQLKGQLQSEVENSLYNSGLEIQVIDSLYIPGERPGGIVDQIPDAGKKVKKGRKIYVTINAFSKEMTTMPGLTNFSLRNAQVNLQNAGLQLGEVTYKPSPYKDLVLEQNINGKPVKNGEKLAKGTRIDLVVAQGDEGGVTYVPSVIGKPAEDARQILSTSRLVMGALNYDESVKSAFDSLDARVFRQSPNANYSTPIDAWSAVQLWLTTDQEKIDAAQIDE